MPHPVGGVKAYSRRSQGSLIAIIIAIYRFVLLIILYISVPEWLSITLYSPNPVQ